MKSVFQFYCLACVLLSSSLLSAQVSITVTESKHKLSGAEVAGYSVDLPFNKSTTEAAWSSYTKSFGRSDEMQGHAAFETVFKPATYNAETLIFVSTQSQGSNNTSLWVGIDAQGVPKDVYPDLKAALKVYLYEFYIKMRIDAAQKQIDDSEKVASLLSKSFEELKREERKNLRDQEKNQLKIEKYEQELVQMKLDSANYVLSLEKLYVKQDSVNIELDKIRKLISNYKQKLYEIQ